MVLRKQSRVIRPVTQRPSENLSEPIDSRRAIGNAQVLRSSEISLPENEVNSCLIDASFPHEDGVLIVVIVRWAYRDL